ncbi:rhomboid family intramembrane serine protease [uncultured Slackia sp.]|uniref:rhomboid family intramembrane serine protease n=1 Tax=uncultured Slackia sp. TaxID=665903 RepID=UPI0026E056B3|nr:rhomboid family intramembrane serine protease [uncultured Slackia sp.]
MVDENLQAEGGAESRRVIDDAELKRMMKASKGSFFQRNAYQAVTLLLIAINVAVYAVEAFSSGLHFDISSRVLVDMGAMYPPLIQSAGDLYRFITPMFLHLDLMHLAFNMVALYSVGALLEQVLGKANFIALYFIGGITGNVVSYLAGIYLEGGMAISAGASTSVFGLFVATALLGVLHREGRTFFAEYSKGMWGVIAANVAYSFLVPGISISGHLGGALGGAIAMFMLPEYGLKVPNPVRVVVAIAWVAFLGWVLVSQGLVG